MEKEGTSGIYGAWAYYCPHKLSEKFPHDGDKLIEVLPGKYTDISEVPERWKKEVMKRGANVIALGQGDKFKIFSCEK